MVLFPSDKTCRTRLFLVDGTTTGQRLNAPFLVNYPDGVSPHTKYDCFSRHPVFSVSVGHFAFFLFALWEHLWECSANLSVPRQAQIKAGKLATFCIKALDRRGEADFSGFETFPFACSWFPILHDNT
jgi:hypothetical protein